MTDYKFTSIVKKIYWVVDHKGKIVSEPYWEKYMAISHAEEVEFPNKWSQLYKKGYRIKNGQVS